MSTDKLGRCQCEAIFDTVYVLFSGHWNQRSTHSAVQRQCLCGPQWQRDHIIPRRNLWRIAVDIPNTQAASALPWGDYRTSVDAIEAATGLDLLNRIPAAVQAELEAGVDSGG
jgi:hypothetical protein